MTIELRLCSRALAKAYPFATIPRDNPKEWYRKRYGLMFGLALHSAFKGDRPLTPEHTILAYKGSVEFENPDQMVWAIHVAGMAAVVQHQPSEEAWEIEQFARGEQQFADIPDALKELGGYALIDGEDARRLAKWIAGVDPHILRDQAFDVHGAEWVSSIEAVVSSIRRVFESTSTHGADICAWKAST